MPGNLELRDTFHLQLSCMLFIFFFFLYFHALIAHGLLVGKMELFDDAITTIAECICRKNGYGNISGIYMSDARSMVKEPVPTSHPLLKG